MKHQAIVGNIGHFDNEIDMAGLAKLPGATRIEIKPQVHEWTFADGHSVIVLSEGRLLNLGNITGRQPRRPSGPDANARERAASEIRLTASARPIPSAFRALVVRAHRASRAAPSRPPASCRREHGTRRSSEPKRTSGPLAASPQGLCPLRPRPRPTPTGGRACALRVVLGRAARLDDTIMRAGGRAGTAGIAFTEHLDHTRWTVAPDGPYAEDHLIALGSDGQPGIWGRSSGAGTSSWTCGS